MYPQMVLEVAQLIASGPTSEQIIAFHPSEEAVDRAYQLLENKRAGTLTKDEQNEIETYLAIEHLMVMAKAEARKKLQRQVS